MSGPIKTGSEIVVVLLKDLNVDPSYQRGLKQHRKQIASNWNPNAAGVLKVGRRSDNTLWLIDGQQRTDAMIRSGIDRWQAEIIESSGAEYEAAIFHLINGPRGRSNLGTQDLFKSALRANDPIAICVKQAIAEAGFVIDFRRHNDTNRGLSCVGTLYRLVAAHGKDIIKRSLIVNRRAWPDNREACRDVVVCGMVYLYTQYGDKIDDERMVKTLTKLNVVTLTQEARFLLGSDKTNMGRVIAKQYNKRLSDKNKIGEDAKEEAVSDGEATER